jgi:hypothetical protein
LGSAATAGVEEVLLVNPLHAKSQIFEFQKEGSKVLSSSGNFLAWNAAVRIYGGVTVIFRSVVA